MDGSEGGVRRSLHQLLSCLRRKEEDERERKGKRKREREREIETER